MKPRPSWDEYFMNMAEVAATRSTCLSRQVGSVIVKDKRILATGYNGAPAGCKHCRDEIGFCFRRKNGIPSGQGLELCRAGHSESNSIDSAARNGVAIEGATMYTTLVPCVFCAIRIINSGIKRVVFKGTYDNELAMQLFKEAGTELYVYQEEGNIAGILCSVEIMNLGKAE